MNYTRNVVFKPFGDHKPLNIILFSLLAFLILAASLIFFTLSIGKPYMGITLSVDDQVWTVQSVDISGIAIQAGIREGDSPIKINGKPAEIFLEKYEKHGIVHGSLINELTTISAAGQMKSVALKDSPQSWKFLTEQLAFLVTCIIFWIIGFYVLFKRPRNIAALLLCLCGLTFGLALSANIAGERAIPAAIPLAVIAATFGPWLLTHFFLVLPEERRWLLRKTQLYLIYLPAVITLVLFFFIGYVDGQPLPWFRTIRLIEYGAGFLTAIIVAIFNYTRTVSIRTRQQMKIALIGCLVALIPFSVLYLLPETLWGKSILPTGFSILLIVFIPLGMGYAVVTRKLMDIDVVIRRGIVYGLITVIMAGILSVAIFFITANYTSLGIPAQILVALVLGGMATALFGPIKKWIEILIDKLFYKDRYDYRQMIQSLSTSLHSVKDFTDVSRLLVGTIVQTLNLVGGCLFVRTQSGSYEIGAAQGTFVKRSKQKKLLTLISQRNQSIEFPSSASSADPDITFIIPLVAADNEVGVLCLSEKATRQKLSTDDMYLLQGLASVAAVALRSAMLIRDVSIRDTFVSIASHELRTPMTAIMGYTELLLQRNPPDTTREQWLINIYENGRKLTDMIDDLLNVTRIRSGKVSMKLEKVRLQDVLEESIAFTRESSDKHEIIVEIEPDLPAVLIDREKFGQVIGNLLGNAIKYSPEGGRITLAARKDTEKSCVVVSVSDEGIGISPEDKDSLFTTFHRIQRPETQGIKGSGLGLYIAKEWTEVMGGDIWLESELNKGSTFFVAIPVQDS